MRVCRLCLASNVGFVDALSCSYTSSGNLHVVIHEMFSFWIKSSDASTLVCFKCLELVEDYHKFYTLVKKSQLSFGQKSEDMPFSYDDVKVEKEEDDSMNDCTYEEVGEVGENSNDKIGPEQNNIEESIRIVSEGCEKFFNPMKAIKVEDDYVDICDQDNIILSKLVEPSISIRELDQNFKQDSSNRYDGKSSITKESKIENRKLESSVKKIISKMEADFDDGSDCDSEPSYNSNFTDFPAELIKNGKFVIKPLILHDIASKFFNLRCRICKHKPRFDKLSEYMEHFPRKHESKAYLMCCRNRFYKNFYIYTHMATHLQPSAFECAVCKKKVTRLDGLKQHLETHLPAEEKSYKCKICGKGYSNSSGLTHHKITHIPVEQRTVPVCSICNKTFSTMASYNVHKFRMHSTPKHLCEECGKTFTVKQSYLDHLELHDTSGKSKVKCRLCGLVYKNKMSLKGHMRIHKAERKYCTLCDFNTHKSNLLKKHMMVKHTDTKPFECGLCNKQFKIKSCLDDHMAHHTGERRYACEYCTRTFVLSGNYYKHRKRMHGDQLKYDLDLKQKQQNALLLMMEAENPEHSNMTVEELARREIEQLKLETVHKNTRKK